LQSTAYFFDPPRAFSRCYRKTYRSQLTQPCIPPGSLNRVPASAGQGQGGNVSSAGWQVTLCDPMWHASSRSGVAALRTAIHSLLTYLLHPGPAWNGPCCRVCGGRVCVCRCGYLRVAATAGRTQCVCTLYQTEPHADEICISPSSAPIAVTLSRSNDHSMMHSESEDISSNYLTACTSFTNNLSL